MRNGPQITQIKRIRNVEKYLQDFKVVQGVEGVEAL